MEKDKEYRKYQATSYNKDVVGEIRIEGGMFVLVISCEGREKRFEMLPYTEEFERNIEWAAERLFQLNASKAALGDLWKEPQKADVRLFGWYIDKAESENGIFWYTSGITLGHPKLLDSHPMNHSSEIVNIQIDESLEEACIETRNTIYHAPLAECDYSKESTYEYLPELKKYREIYEPKQNQYEMEDESVLLVFSDHDYYYFRYGAILQEGQKKKLKISPHIGTFQDSVLVYPENEFMCGGVDIRYFPHPGHIDFYGLDYPDECRLFVENRGDRDFYIDYSRDSRICLLPGERKLFDKSSATPKNEGPSLMGGDLYPAGIIL